MIKYVLKFFLFVNLLLLIYNCSATSTSLVIDPAPTSPMYDVASPKESEEKLNVNVAILKMDFGGNNKKGSMIEFPYEGNAFASQTEFIKALEASIESIVVSKGYFIVDFVDDFDTLTEEDKKKIDYLIVPKINLDAVENIEMGSKVPLDLSFERSSRASIKCSGDVALKGEMAFSIIDPITRDIIYSTKDELSESTPFKVSLDKYTGNTLADVLYKELTDKCLLGVNNARAKTLEKIYKSYLKSFQKSLPSGKKAKELFGILR
ncbi:MAG: hypothetical protein SVN78_05505 [Deferribacterota bacterium]|nr:hypothetical protein [Deferribacterota bacterium]